tara:strand:- start:3299 stop:4033 length:735 start_codon:yes stop_codon:yes gene_type:complete
MKDYGKRANQVRRDVLNMALETGEAHLGGCFSEADIMVVLFDEILNNNDNFILSKGHACYTLYVLLKEKGLNPKIAGHPDMCTKEGLCCTTGSLGHGLPIGIGKALARKLKNKEGKIYVLISDGECQEGTTWESALLASHHKLDNLVVIIDNNKLQALQPIEDVLSLGDLKQKFESFGWFVSEVDGHNFQEISEALKKFQPEKPHIIIANTTKGKGVSYMENDPKWHTRMPTEEELKIAFEELK